MEYQTSSNLGVWHLLPDLTENKLAKGFTYINSYESVGRDSTLFHTKQHSPVNVKVIQSLCFWAVFLTTGKKSAVIMTTRKFWRCKWRETCKIIMKNNQFTYCVLAEIQGNSAARRHNSWLVSVSLIWVSFSSKRNSVRFGCRHTGGCSSARWIVIAIETCHNISKQQYPKAPQSFYWINFNNSTWKQRLARRILCN